MKTLSLLFAMAVLCGACGRCEPDPSAVLESVQPSVHIGRGSAEPLSANNDSQLFVGDVVSTDETGSASIRFGPNTVVKLGPLTSVLIEAGADGLAVRRIKLLFGDIEASGTGRDLMVSTRLGNIQFGDDDNQVAVHVGDDAMTVRTIIGEVRMGDTSITSGVTISIDSNGIRFNDRVDAGREDATIVANDLGETAPIVVTLTRGKGVVRQVEGKGRFVSVAPGSVLGNGDVVEAKKGEATLTFSDGGKFIMQRRARVGIGNDDGNGASVEVKHGDSALVLGAKQSQLLVVPGAKVAVTASEHGAQVSLSTTKKGTLVRVYEGRSTVQQSDGASVDILASQEAVLSSKGRATVRQVKASSLRVSSKVRKIYVSGGLPALSLTWGKLSGGGPYTLEIAKDEQFSKPVVVTDVMDNEYTSDRLGYGVYHWRVRNASRAQPARAFTIARDNRVDNADARKNIVRASAERTVVVYQQWQSPQLTFRWPKHMQAANYRINIYADGAFEKPVLEKLTDTADLVLPPGTLKDGRYVWAVSSLDAANAILSTSDMYDLQVKFDSNKMLLRILAPAPRTRVRGSTIETRGMVEPGTPVSVNGVDAKPDASGRFSVNVPVSREDPMLLYRVGSNIFVRALR